MDEIEVGDYVRFEGQALTWQVLKVWQEVLRPVICLLESGQSGRTCRAVRADLVIHTKVLRSAV